MRSPAKLEIAFKIVPKSILSAGMGFSRVIVFISA
jgi:hypothetical protein